MVADDGDDDDGKGSDDGNVDAVANDGTAKVPMMVIVIMLEIVLGGAGGWLLCC